MAPNPRQPRRRQGIVLADAVNQIGPGPYQLIVLLLGGGVYMAEGSLLLIVSLVAKDIINYWQLSAFVAASMAGFVFVGLVLGTAVGGTASDIYGRRMPILVTYVGILVFITCCLMSPYILPLLVAKFMLGVCLGFGLPASNAIVIESCPPTHRANIYSMTMVLFSMGQMYSASGLWLLNPELKSDEPGWRATLAIGLLPPAVFAIGAHFFLLESAHWLTANHHFVQAKQVILTMAKYNQTDTMAVEFALTTIDSTADTESRQERAEEASPLLGKDRDDCHTALWRVANLFSPTWRKTTFIMSYIAFASNFAYYGMIYGLPHTFKAMPVKLKTMSPAAAVFIAAVFEIPGVFLCILLGNTLGRRTNIFISFFCTSLALVGVTYSLILDHMDTWGLWSTFAVKMFIASGFIIVYLYLLECYPTMFRATGLAFCMVVGRFGALACPFLYDGLVHYEIPSAWFFLAMMIMTLTASILSCLLPLETKDTPLPEK